MNGISDFVLSITGDDPPALWRFVSLVPTAQCDAQRRDGDLYGSGVMASTWDKSPWWFNLVYPLVNIQKTMENHHF